MSTKRKRSCMWYHFTSIEGNRSECNYCKAVISTASGSFGNMKRHLKNKHPTLPLENLSVTLSEENFLPISKSEMPPSSSRSRSRSPSAASTSTVADLDSFKEETRSRLVPPPNRTMHSSLTEFAEVLMPLSTGENKTIDAQLLRMICKEYHSLSLVDDAEFKKFVSLLCPGYKLPSRETLSKSLLPQVYNELVVQVKNKIDDSIAVALSVDEWTSMSKQNFIAITAHYVDSNSILCSNLLGCIEITKIYDSFDLASILKNHCEEWNIDSKLMAIVTEHSVDIAKAANDVSKSNHIACFTHDLIQIVKSSFSPINDTIEKCNIFVQYFKRNSIAMAKLCEIQKQMDLPEQKLIQAVPTRWYSTYEMMTSIFSNKEPILNTVTILKYDEPTFSNDDWIIIEQAIGILEVFNDMLKELSTPNSVTLSKTMILTRNLYDYLNDMSNRTDLPNSFREVCDELLKQIGDKLIPKEHILIPESALLDPRFKKYALKHTKTFDTVYESLVKKVENLISEDQMQNNPQPQSGYIKPDPDETASSSKIWERYDKETLALTLKRNPKAASIAEMDKYLSEPLLPRLLDPLLWWEHRKLIYPNLYKLAMERLCIPASTVPSERIFSKTAQIMAERRTTLNTKKLSTILFVQANS